MSWQVIVYLFYFLLCSEITIGQTDFYFFVAADKFATYDPAFCLMEVKSKLIKLKILETEPKYLKNNPNIQLRKKLSEEFYQKNYSKIPTSCLIFFLKKDTITLYCNQDSLIEIATLKSENFLMPEDSAVNSNTKNWIVLSLLYWQLETTEKFIREKVDSTQANKEISYLNGMEQLTDKDKLKREYLLGLLYEKKENPTEAFKHYLKAGDKGKETINRLLTGEFLDRHRELIKTLWWDNLSDSCKNAFKGYININIQEEPNFKNFKQIFETEAIIFESEFALRDCDVFRFLPNLKTVKLRKEDQPILFNKQCDCNKRITFIN
jgi:hypothetical protein